MASTAHFTSAFALALAVIAIAAPAGQGQPISFLSTKRTVANSAFFSDQVAARISGHNAAQDVRLWKLRVCNAFASRSPLEMRRVQEPQLVEYPVPFKECRDYELPLREGDELMFRKDRLEVGTFKVSGLPNPGDSLLLVPHRRDARSEAIASFSSHVFAGGAAGAAQVAFVDATSSASGRSLPASSVLLAEGEEDETPRNKQELNFNSVVSLPLGSYNLALRGANGKGTNKAALDARRQAAYVALRVGGAAGYPEELVVFPHVSLAGEASTIARSGAHGQRRGALMWGTSILALSCLRFWA